MLIFPNRAHILTQSGLNTVAVRVKYGRSQGQIRSPPGSNTVAVRVKYSCSQGQCECQIRLQSGSNTVKIIVRYSRRLGKIQLQAESSNVAVVRVKYCRSQCQCQNTDIVKVKYNCRSLGQILTQSRSNTVVTSQSRNAALSTYLLKKGTSKQP